MPFKVSKKSASVSPGNPTMRSAPMEILLEKSPIPPFMKGGVLWRFLVFLSTVSSSFLL